MMPKNRDTLILTLVAAAFFVVSIIVRFLLADFPKGVGVLPDEIRYLDLASSLLNEGQLIERGGFSSFQKILYPLSLLPAYLADDPQMRVTLIALLNSIYVSSAVFPALLIARRLFATKVPVVICLLFTVIMPDMCYSMTFLSECIYLPLVLWLVACCLRALEARGRAGYAWCAVAGLLCYVTYLAKEVALGFALAFVVMMIVRIVRERRDEATHEGDAGAKPGISSRPAMSATRSCEGECVKGPALLTQTSPTAQVVDARFPHEPEAPVALPCEHRTMSAAATCAVSLVCFIAGFILPFIILKLTLFSGLLNSYNQTDPSVLLNPYTLLFSLYAFLSDTTHFVIALAFFPLVLPALTWPRLTRRERELCLFCLLAFVFILLIVIYTISIREDLGHVGIRPHVRYVAPIFLPLLFLIIKQIVRGDGVAIMRSPVSFAGAIAATVVGCLLVIFMLGTGDYSQGFDSAQFHSLRLLAEQLPGLPIDPNADLSARSGGKDIYHGEFLDISPGIWLSKALVCAYLVFGMWAFASRKHPKFVLAVPILIAVAMIANNVGAYQYNNAVYRIDDEEAAEMCALEGLVDELPEGEQVLVVVDDENSAFNNHTDVYVDNSRLNCTYIREEQLRSTLEQGPVDHRQLLLASGQTMGDNIFGVNGRVCDDTAGITYVVAPRSQRLDFANGVATDVTPDGIESVIVYRLASDVPVLLVPTAIQSSSSR